MGDSLIYGDGITLEVVVPKSGTAPESADMDQLIIALGLAEREKTELHERYLKEKKEWEVRFGKLEATLQALNTKETSAEQAEQANVSTSSPILDATESSKPTQSETYLQVPLTDTKGKDLINVQIEHIVESDPDYTFQHRLRPFSGNTPKSGEVDFDEWVKQAEMVIEDEGMSDRSKKQKLLSSLHSPALDLARSLGDVSAKDLFNHLEELYGSTANSVRLLHEFFKMQPGQNEKPPDYLQCMAGC